VKGVISQGQIV